MTISTKIRAFRGTSALVLMLGASPAFAQAVPAADQASDTGNDIVVIARRREERLIDVPIAVTAISDRQFQQQGAIDLSAVQGQVPNVNLVQGRGSSSSANIFIRGIGQPDALQTFDPAVGIYVDGVYISRIQGALFNLFDVERIEVLRGPQGTLYGKNTIGGAVNIISRKPDLSDFHASGSATYGRFNQVLVNGYVTAPLITDKLALSLAGVYDKRDGFVTDPLTGRKYNDRDTLAGRAILRAKPTDRVEITLAADYTRQRTALTLGYPTAPLFSADLITGAATQLVPANPYGPYHYTASTSLPAGNGQRLDHWGVAGTVDIELSDAVSLTSITAYRKLRPDLYIDIDGSQVQLGDAFVGINQHQFSQELQLKYDSGPLKGVLGLYYLDENIRSHQIAFANDYLRIFGTPATFRRTVDDDQTTRSYAAFGQATYDFTDQLSVTAGLRYTRDKKHYFRTTSIFLNGAQFGPAFVFPTSLPAPYNSADTATFEAWTPSATLSFKPTRGTLLYVSASRGFKSGGFNGRLNGLADATQVINGVPTIVPFFKPEKVWTYEAGAKGNFLDGRVSLSGDVFYSDYTDFQARVGGGATGIAGGSFPVVNAGKLRIWGIEAEATVKPVTELTLVASFGYLNAKYEKFDDGRRAPAFSCNPTGNQIVCKPAFSPPVTFSLAANYAVPLGTAGTFTFGGDARFVDKQYLSVDNRPGLVEDGYWLANAFVQYDNPAGWYLRGGVKNLFKALYKTDAQEFSSVGNIQTVYYGDPRTWQITAGFRL